MNIKDICTDIMTTDDPCDRADRLEELLKSTCESIPEDVIIKFLEDPYDVIRAEVLDYMINNDIIISSPFLESCILREESIIVRGRLCFYCAVPSFPPMLFDVAVRNLCVDSEYDQVWLASANYRRSLRFDDFWHLASYLCSSDPAVCNICMSVSDQISSRSHKVILKSLLDLIKASPDHKLNPKAVESFLKSIKAEKPLFKSVTEIRQQMWGGGS